MRKPQQGVSRWFQNKRWSNKLHFFRPVDKETQNKTTSLYRGKYKKKIEKLCNNLAATKKNL